MMAYAPFRPHDSGLMRGPGDGEVPPEALPRHGQAPAAVMFPHRKGDRRDRRRAVHLDHPGAVADEPASLLVDGRQESGSVGEPEEGNIESVAEVDEAGHLVRRVDSETPALVLGIVGNNPDAVTVQPGKPGDQVAGPVPLDLEELPLVNYQGDQLVHVVGFQGVHRDEVDQLFFPSVRVIPGVHHGGIFAVVRGKVAQELAAFLKAILVALGEDIADPCDAGVPPGIADPGSLSTGKAA